MDAHGLLVDEDKAGRIDNRSCDQNWSDKHFALVGREILPLNLASIRRTFLGGRVRHSTFF
jgi:hypothetical protein